MNLPLHILRSYKRTFYWFEKCEKYVTRPQKGLIDLFKFL